MRLTVWRYGLVLVVLLLPSITTFPCCSAMLEVLLLDVLSPTYASQTKHECLRMASLFLDLPLLLSLLA